MLESKVEKEFTTQVKRLKGWAIKLLPTITGLPDRLAIFPGGRIIFVELKAPKKRLYDRQEIIHRKLRSLGCTVVVLKTVEEVRAWAEAQELF